MPTKALNHVLKRKKLIFLLGALGFTSYGAYKVFNSPSVIKNKDRIIKIFSALASITEFVGDSAETLGVISKDLKSFIQSDSDQIPCSLKQVFKITKSDEFSDSIIRVSRALTIGVSKGLHIEGEKDHSGSCFSDRVLDKLFSPDGYGFVSVMVGSFSRNMVMAIYADRGLTTGSKWVDVITDDKFRKVIGDCIQQFVTTMVTVYLDKTMDINTYDEIISSLTDPKHEQQVRSLMGLICNGAVETFVRTSHQVLTNSKSNGESDSNASSSYLIKSGSSTISKVFGQRELVLSKLTGRNYINGNMRFILDLTKRLTLATVKSFLGCLLNQLSMGLKTSFLEAYRYLNAKSMVVMTVWISLYLHMFSRPWSLISVV